MNGRVVLLLCAGLLIAGLTANALRSGEMAAKAGRIRRAQAPLAFNAALILRTVIALLCLGAAAAEAVGWLPLRRG